MTDRERSEWIVNKHDCEKVTFIELAKMLGVGTAFRAKRKYDWAKRRLRVIEPQNICGTTLVASIGLSIRASNAIREAGIITVKELSRTPIVVQKKWRNFGIKSINEVISLLNKTRVSFELRCTSCGQPLKEIK